MGELGPAGAAAGEVRAASAVGSGEGIVTGAASPAEGSGTEQHISECNDIKGKVRNAFFERIKPCRCLTGLAARRLRYKNTIQLRFRDAF